ncbi:hypothetical protein N5D52_19310 [Pseudomonas sp. GD03860]|uniref:Bbp19 family protein n=1 Tax=Pseudomonas TaxID=286 RepID=UPI000B06C933|nr:MULTISPECIES: hypothetical protein [Pseudomonas]MDH0639088.1 hypothetical protein [Pseudomonas sp. GD03860]
MTQYTSEQLDDMFKRVFEQHAEGVIVLDQLVQKFSKNAVTVGGIDAVLRTYLQAGHREVLDHILRRINRANGVQDQPEEE